MIDIAVKIYTTCIDPFLLIFPKFEPPVVDELVNSLVFWTLRVWEDTWTATMKLMTLYMFSKSQRVEEPSEPLIHPLRLSFGPLGEIMYKMLFGSGRKKKIWRNTVLHGIKKGMPTVSEEFICKSLEKHGQILSTDPEPHPEFLKLVREVSDCVLGPLTFDEAPKVSQKVTLGSCCENNRANGGNLGVILPVGSLGEWNELVKMYYHPKLGVTEVRTNKDLVELSALRSEGLYSSSKPKWMVEFIREPLKCRIITRGEFTCNGSWSDIQKAMWERLQDFPCFRLTKGHTLDGEDIIALSHATFLDKYENGFWASGDYSAATDSIHRDVMRAALHGIKDPLLQNLMDRNLSQGIITYEHLLRGKRGLPFVPETFEQSRGQLMGSLFSFPILCLINLCTYLHARRSFPHLFKRQTSSLEEEIRTASVLVNGDDILFWAPHRRFYDVWEYGAKTAGFSLSVGKSYTSRHLALVNSRFYETKGPWPVGPVPYVNMGIIRGVKKGESDCIARSRREKMCTLPGYFRDTWKDFGEKERDMRGRIEAYIRATREDVRWSPFSSYTMGITEREDFAEMAKTVTDLTSRCERSFAYRHGLPNRFNCEAEKSYYWRHASDVNTDVLRKKDKKVMNLGEA
jgi:hypothetical protein